MGVHRIHRGLIAVALALALGLSACAPNISANTVSPSEAGRLSQAISGTVVSSRGVMVREDRPGVLTAAGAVAGGIGGSQIGGGRAAPAAAAVGGALLGGLVGYGLERAITSNTGIEYFIRLDDGRTVTVIQDDDMVFPPGSRVLVALGPRARVLPGSALPAASSPTVVFAPSPGYYPPPAPGAYYPPPTYSPPAAGPGYPYPSGGYFYR